LFCELVRVLSVVPFLLLSFNSGFVHVRGLTVPLETFVTFVQNLKKFCVFVLKRHEHSEGEEVKPLVKMH
jgi:hypothetical protein